MNGPKSCFPACRKFRCGKNAVDSHGRKTWCRWTDEPCDLSNCTYAMCVSRRLLPGGICGETVKRKTTERGIEEIESIGPTIKVKGKTFRKIGEKEIF
ncbi:MAG: hypothetical protein OEZ48_14120 [Candidatus Bathyarchaeota archaeon]|nr:hypothetical protein [Candidatus Bathyarchaeota archaeon]MDH5688980.1 hypothetical protein [Candidatus Bathyarchaeota archaeon]